MISPRSGRRAGNGTFFESHATDQANQWIFGMDLTPLMMDDSRDIGDYVANFIKELESDVRGKLTTRLGI